MFSQNFQISSDDILMKCSFLYNFRNFHPYLKVITNLRVTICLPYVSLINLSHYMLKKLLIKKAIFTMLYDDIDPAR